MSAPPLHYEDDPGAPGEGLYTAAEKRARDRHRRIMLLVVVLFLALLLAGLAQAAKITVTWANPTLNTDGSALTDLAHVRVEWGSCAGDAFDTVQASIQVAAPATTTPIYPTGLSTVCVRAFAVNSAGIESDSSNVASKEVLNTLGRPVTLGQPIVLP